MEKSTLVILFLAIQADLSKYQRVFWVHNTRFVVGLIGMVSLEFTGRPIRKKVAYLCTGSNLSKILKIMEPGKELKRMPSQDRGEGCRLRQNSVVHRPCRGSSGSRAAD